MNTFSVSQSGPIDSTKYGGVVAKKPTKKRVATKTRKMKVSIPKKKSTTKNVYEIDPDAMVLESNRTQTQNQNAMILQRSTSEPRAFMDMAMVGPQYVETPADLLSGTPQTVYDPKKPSEITLYIAGHGEEVFPRKDRENPFSAVLMKLIESKKMRVRMINKTNAPLVEGLAMARDYNGKTVFKTEDVFYQDSLVAFKNNRTKDTKKIMKQLGKDFIVKYRNYLLNIGEKSAFNKGDYERIQLKKEILKKSTYLDLYHPTHEKYFYIRPMSVVSPENKDDSNVLRYGIYVVDIRNSPHENVFWPTLNISPMHEEYKQYKSMYADMISYLKLLLCSYDSPKETDVYRQGVCNSIEKIVIPDNKITTTSLSDILILFYSLGFTNINIIDSTCRVDCGSNEGVCSYYKIDNLSECNYNIKKSLIEIAKLKKDLVISPYSESSPESGKKIGITAKKKIGPASTANIAKKFTRK